MNNNKQALENLVPLFIKSLEDKKRSPSTILAYRSDLEQLVGYLKERSVLDGDSVRAENLAAFRDDLIEKKYTAKSASRKLNAVKTFFRWLKDEGHIEKDHSRDVSHPKIESSVPKFLSQLEYRALRDVIRHDTRIASIVEIILQTGMRISEVANLKIEHIKKDVVIIEAYATQGERSIELNNRAKEAIEDYLRERPVTEGIHLYVSKNGKPLAVRNIRASIDRYMQKAEIPEYSVNDIRNTFIVENLKRGVDLVTISVASGHKRLSTTERYLELAEVKDPGKKQKLEEL